MDDKRLDRYDQVVNAIVQDLMGTLIHDECISLQNFCASDDEHLLILRLTNIVATAWKRKFYVDCNLIDWLKLKVEYPKLRWRHRRTNFVVSEYLDQLRANFDDFPQGFGEIYQVYYVKGTAE